MSTEWEAAWRAESGRLLGLAYRILGAFGDAQDVVADAAERVARMSEAERGAVRSWPAFLTRTVVNRSLDVLRSAARRREEYAGPWLPEPVDSGALPEDRALERETLTIGLLHLMEELSPTARASFVLSHAFGFRAMEIAEIVGLSPAAVRQQLSRASRALSRDVATAVASGGEVRGRLEALVDAVSAGDVEGTLRLLSEDVVLWMDGGGAVRSALNPIFGGSAVARFLAGVFSHGRAHPSRRLHVNGHDAVELGGGQGRKLMCLTLADGRIESIRVVSNPAKLHFVSQGPRVRR